MSAATMKPCLVCRKLTRENRCPDHSDNRRRDQKSRAHGVRGKGSARWIELRATKLALNPVCELRMDGRCTARATTVHIDPALKGDHTQATIADCKSACSHCHGRVDGGRANQR